MYVHIGGEKVVRSSELIAIFDISIENASNETQQFLNSAHKNKTTEVVSDEKPKSLVITNDKVYYSPISSSTLKKRSRLNYG